MDDRAGRSESTEHCFRVIGKDTDGRVMLDIPSKSEHAAEVAIRFLQETHPKLMFSVRPIEPPGVSLS